MTNNNILENTIKKLVKESIQEIIQERKIAMVRNVIKEEITKYVTKKRINEDNEKNKRLDLKRNSVMSMLKDDIYDHAPLAYALWPDMDKDTARSLFSKKATGTPDADNQIRHFNDTEINKLYDLMRQRK